MVNSLVLKYASRVVLGSAWLVTGSLASAHADAKPAPERVNIKLPPAQSRELHQAMEEKGYPNEAGAYTSGHWRSGAALTCPMGMPCELTIFSWDPATGAPSVDPKPIEVTVGQPVARRIERALITMGVPAEGEGRTTGHHKDGLVVTCLMGSECVLSIYTDK